MSPCRTRLELLHASFLCRFGYGSVERLIDWLEECDNISEGSSILDVGCGNGVMLTELVSI